MKPFKKYYQENVFKPASPEEVEERYSLTDPTDMLTAVLDDENVAMVVTNLKAAVQKAVNDNVKGAKVMSREERFDGLLNWVGEIVRDSAPEDVSPVLIILYSGEIE